MRPSKSIYYADFVVYPVVIVGLAAFGLTRSNWQNRVEWLCIAMAGFVLWTLSEYVVHRSVLHRKTYFAPMHGQHHTAPLAYLGTPAWVSVAVLSGSILVPTWYWVGFKVADGLTVGVMAGYWWYGVVHHVIHHHANTASPSYFNELRAWHMRHHYSPKKGNFGVTTSIWDRVFGTTIRSQGKATASP